MYTIVMDGNKNLLRKEVVTLYQREKLVDKFRFLIPVEYEGFDLTTFTATLKYVDQGNVAHAENLVRAEETYKDVMSIYYLPIDTQLTRFAGDIVIRITLSKNDYKTQTQHVLHTGETTVTISPLKDMFAFAIDESLEVLDQRIIKQDAQIQALAEIAVALSEDMVDNLVYNEKEDTLQLSANGIGVGDKVSVKDMLDEGIPVVDLNSSAGGGSSDDGDHEDGCDCGCDCEDNVVVFSEMPTTDNSGNTEDDEVVEF